MVGGVVERHLQAGATVRCQETKELRKIIPRLHHPQQKAKAKATVQYAAVAPFWILICRSGRASQGKLKRGEGVGHVYNFKC